MCSETSSFTQWESDKAQQSFKLKQQKTEISKKFKLYLIKIKKTISCQICKKFEVFANNKQQLQ